jgi:hypothetical protein
VQACVSAAGGTSSESDSELRVHKRGPGARFSAWLGHWKPEYDAMDQNELMLQVLAAPAAAAARCSAAPPRVQLLSQSYSSTILRKFELQRKCDLPGKVLPHCANYV